MLFGFVPMIVSMILSIIVLQFPRRPTWTQGACQLSKRSSGARRASGSPDLAYGVSTFLNVTIFSRLKAREGKGLLWLRSAIASILSQIVDTFIFITVAFYGVFPITELILGQMIAKVVLSALLVPPFVYGFVAIGKTLDKRP